ncbi:MAG: hypothetical protein NXH97_22740 [Rhodobacteraceae bacterium]|nr:hypothetical protein [Paracoccaceae bacterium]
MFGFASARRVSMSTNSPSPETVGTGNRASLVGFIRRRAGYHMTAILVALVDQVLWPGKMIGMMTTTLAAPVLFVLWIEISSRFRKLHRRHVYAAASATILAGFLGLTKAWAIAADGGSMIAFAGRFVGKAAKLTINTMGFESGTPVVLMHPDGLASQLVGMISLLTLLSASVIVFGFWWLERERRRATGSSLTKRERELAANRILTDREAYSVLRKASRREGR